MRGSYFVSLFLLVACCFAGQGFAAPVEPFAPVPQICFTPGGRCDVLIIEAIDNAQKTIRVAAYSFTSKPIAAALIRARERNIKVWIVLDRSQLTARGGQAFVMREKGIGVRFDLRHAIMHNKFMVIDNRLSITGSYNFTESAQKRNAENVLVLHDRATAREYANEWGRHWYHGERELY